MAIKFKTEFLQMIFVRDLIILLKLILLCLINKLIPILGQPFILFIYLRGFDTNQILPWQQRCHNPSTMRDSRLICHFLGKCLFHAIHTIFKAAIFSALFDRRNNYIHPCSSRQDWQFVKHTILFSSDFFPDS